MTEREYFTYEEVHAKVGRQVKTLVDFSGVPRDTTGQVVRADSAGRTKPMFGEAFETYDVGVQWNLPREPIQIERSDSAGEVFMAITGGRPLVDWFSKDEYEQYLEELESDD